MKVISYPSAPLSDATWQPVDPDRVIEGTPKTAYRLLHTSASEEFYSGIYQSTPGKWRISYTEDEFCTLIEGRVRLTDEQGNVSSFSTPESFLIPSGFKGTWESVTDVRKFFVIYEKAK